MASGCPINNLIPEWNDLVYRGQWHEASDPPPLGRTTSPSSPGRVCPAPCEGSCTVGINGDPVAIKTIEQEIADRAWDEGWITPSPPLARTGSTVAVIGQRAGRAWPPPTSSTAPGHLVTVFERAGRIGGLLMYGIPNMKLDKDVVAAAGRAHGGRGRPLRHRRDGRRGRRRRSRCWRSTTPWSSRPAPPSPATCPCPAASWAASTSR